jgi:hypothetical protein
LTVRDKSAARHAPIVLALVSMVVVASLLFAGPTFGIPTALQTSSPTPTPTPSPTSPPAPREVALSASDRKVDAGADVRLFGEVVSTDPECERQESVKIRRRFVGQNGFKELRSVSTDSGGDFETRLPVDRSAEYWATLFGTSGCERTDSDNVAVFVRVVVTINTSSNPIDQGAFFTISGAVKPGHRGTKVILERKRTRGWSTVSNDFLGGRSRYEFNLSAGWEGERSFRVRWPSQDHDHEPNTSRILTLRSV